MQKLSKSLGFSLFIHLLFIFGISIWSPILNKNRTNNVFEITVDSEPPDKSQNETDELAKQIIRQAMAPEKLKLPEDETLAKLLSQEQQRVKEEVQAAQKGLTENRTQISTEKAALENRQQTENFDKDGYREINISQELNELKNLNSGVSSFGDSIPKNVKTGSFTALNTDRYLFYSFYSRIEELVRFRWESRVMMAINKFDRATAINTGNKNWNTQMEFILDQHGVLLKTILIKSCGISAFDQAAIDAFKDAKVFPNPPPEMIKDDGFIHLMFAFDVNYLASALANRI